MSTAPAEVEFDPRWEWMEIASLDRAVVRHIKVRCNHLEVVPVTSVTGETVAQLCRTCDTQLPPPREAP